jgi:hypothetical protein
MSYLSKSATEEINALLLVCEQQHSERSRLDELMLDSCADAERFLKVCSMRRELNIRFMANKFKLHNMVTNQPRNGREERIYIAATLSPHFKQK